MDLKREVEFFDSFADNSDYDVLSERGYERLLGAFRSMVTPRPGERCVDLGCGTGAFTRRLRGLGLEMTGMDISPRSIERARSQTAGARYLVGDIRDTRLPPGSCDIVSFSGVLHHLPTPDDRLRALREGARILRGGGRIFSFDPNAHSPAMVLYRDPRSPLCSNEGKTPNEVLIDPRELGETLRSAGMVDVHVRGLAGVEMGYVAGRFARRLLPLYNLYERSLSWSPLGSILGAFVVSTASTPATASHP